METSIIDFTHLHLHSDYSLLDGFCPLKELVKKGKLLGFNSLALTDHGTLYGLVEFSRECHKEGLKPLLGMEAYVAPRLVANRISREEDNNYHLVLLAKDESGYQNLCKLATIAQLEGMWYKPRIDREILSRHSKGLVALSACLSGEISSKLLKGDYQGARESAAFYQNLFQDDYYLELERHGLKEQQAVEGKIVKLSQELGIKLVATNDVHYLNRQDSLTQRCLLAIGTSSTIDNPKISFEGEEYYLKSPQEMAELFQDLPMALKNTLEVRDKITFNLPLNTSILPKVSLPPGFATQFEYLKHLTYEGLPRRYNLPLSTQVRERVEYELSVINSLGFAGYFIIVADFVNFAKSRDIRVGTGRGSASGSVVSYALNITDIDPIKFGLFFERFLNTSRVAPPDIDIDFSDNRREEVINYLREKYGEKSVAQIITFGSMKARGAIRDVSRALSIPLNEADKIAKLIPENTSLKKALEEVPELNNLYKSADKYKKLLDLAGQVEGRPRHSSKHAAGVVIYDGDITDLVPLQKSTSGLQTQYAMNSLEALGLLKMDILGLKTLTVMVEAEHLIRRKNPDFSLDKAPFNDEKTYKLLKKAQTIGVFQLESSGMRRVLRDLGPEKLSDLMILLALYRPGPMEQIKEFLARRKGKKVEYPHPALKDALAETHGIVVYQEQILEMVRNVAGYSFTEADNLRAAIGKKKVQIIEDMRKDFIERTMEYIKVGREEAHKLFQIIEAFSNYGFNKAHAASYAFTSYRTAYLKANYPAEFLTASMMSDERDLKRMPLLVEEALSMGIKVLPPDISLSEARTSLTSEGIRFGLCSVKNVGEGAAWEIQNNRGNRPFLSLEDFLTRIESTKVNKKAVESLIKVGALDSLKISRNELLRRLGKAGSSGSLTLVNGSLFGSTMEENKENNALTSGYSEEELLEFERELLGVYISGHPLRGYRSFWEEKNLFFISEFLSSESTNGKIGGKIIKAVRQKSRIGNPLIRFQLSDLSGETEVLVMPKQYEKFSEIIDKKGLVILEVKVEREESRENEENQVRGVIANRLIEFIEEDDYKKYYKQDDNSPTVLPTTQAEEVPGSYIHVQLLLPFADEALLTNLKQILETYRGDSPVELFVKKGGFEVRLHLNNYYFKICQESQNALFNLLTPACVRIYPLS